jgi:L-serine/L-threonine ammonia-lyase
MILHIETPLMESRSLSTLCGRSVWLKFESMQPSGSFKIRGIGHACLAYQRHGAQHFISSSGGNAGLAVAYAGRRLGVPVTVVVPETTTEHAKELLQLENAEVIVKGASWQEAHAFAQTLQTSSHVFLHPFDDPLLWQGHSTMIDEIAKTNFKPDVLVVAVGGGGLLSGVVQGLHRHGWHDIPVIAVETKGAASFHAAVERGHTVELDRITSVATSLGAKQVCARALQCVYEHPIHSLVVSDSSALSACEHFLSDHRVLVEPACGAALSLVYDHHGILKPRSHVLIIVCGGATTTIDQIRTWLTRV